MIHKHGLWRDAKIGEIAVRVEDGVEVAGDEDACGAFAWVLADGGWWRAEGVARGEPVGFVFAITERDGCAEFFIAFGEDVAVLIEAWRVVLACGDGDVRFEVVAHVLRVRSDVVAELRFDCVEGVCLGFHAAILTCDVREQIRPPCLVRFGLPRGGRRRFGIGSEQRFGSALYGS